jgi:hypothetical protein
MVECKVIYQAAKDASGRQKLNLTLVGSGDVEVLKAEGVGTLRRRRLKRIAKEASEQGCPIGYSDISSLLFTSVSTLKRDINILEKEGDGIPIRGRHKKKVTVL